MSIEHLNVTNVRNIEYASIDPGTNLNLLIGENGSGKTSILESIYILGRARSFRSRSAQPVIREHSESLVVSGRLSSDSNPSVQVGVRLGSKDREIVIAGRRLLGSAELITTFPVLLVHPANVALLMEAPRVRRQLMDWGLFHVEHGFLADWRCFSRALAQRNSILRHKGSLKDLSLWDSELALYGEKVAESRRKYIEKLEHYFAKTVYVLMGANDYTIKLHQGWSEEYTLLAKLNRDVSSDIKVGYTASGPHKADFSVMFNNRLARVKLSRGQMKMLMLSLFLAQVHLLNDSCSAECTVLIDDLASELDQKNLLRVMCYLMEFSSQFFLTFVERSSVDSFFLSKSTLFHMEHGKIQPVI